MAESGKTHVWVLAGHPPVKQIAEIWRKKGAGKGESDLCGVTLSRDSRLQYSS